MMNIRMLLIGILIVYGSCAGLALKCYVCTNLQNVNCLKKLSPAFLTECPAETTECTLDIRRDQSVYVYRTCRTKDWVCKYDCDKCNTDGCNSGTEVEVKVTPNSTVNITPMEIIMANIYGIGAIALVVFLLLIWIITKACSKNNDDDEDYEDDEVDYEYDEEDYEDDDSIEKEYDEYEYAAEQEYEEAQRMSEDVV